MYLLDSSILQLYTFYISTFFLCHCLVFSDGCLIRYELLLLLITVKKKEFLVRLENFFNLSQLTHMKLKLAYQSQIKNEKKKYLKKFWTFEQKNRISKPNILQLLLIEDALFFCLNRQCYNYFIFIFIR